MNEYITGITIKKIRKQNKLTQSELADLLCVSNKTISKWETGKGYPDIEMLETLSKVLKVSLIELFEGNILNNSNVSSNLLKSKFYVCPICGNIITSVGEGVISCHGITLSPLQAKEEKNLLHIEIIENEYFVSINHEMTKDNYISFISAVSADSIQIKKLYPESNAEAYFKRAGVRFIYYFDNQEGLFVYRLK